MRLPQMFMIVETPPRAQEKKTMRSAELSPPVVMDARGLKKAFGGQVVLDGIDVTLRQGEVVLLRGGNGSGKTTLLNVLTGNLLPDSGVLILTAQGGSAKHDQVFAFPRSSVRRLNPFDHFAPESLAQHGVGRSWQETRLFGTQTLADNIAVAAPCQSGENPLLALLRPFTVRRQNKVLHHQAERALEDLGLPDRSHSTASRVSLGQSKRVGIARAVQAGAKVLFLDEPLAGLDESGIADVLALLQNLAHDEGLTLVIVEHVFNIPRILDFANSVWTLSDGLLNIEEPATVRAEVESELSEGFSAWLRDVAGANGELSNESLPGGAILSRVRPEGSVVGDVILEVENLCVWRGERLIIGQKDGDEMQGITFSLAQGELCVLQAPNGWGKSTLLEAIVGLLPSTGEIRLQGQSLKKQPAWTRRCKGLSFLQSRNHTFAGLSVRESLRLSEVKDELAGLEGLLDHRTADLSGGEKQKVALSCALSGDWNVALLDEPFLALDVSALGSTWEVLQGHLSRRALLLAVPGGSYLA